MRERFSKGSFLYNLSLSSSSGVGVFLVQIISTPIVSRIYSPKDYGTLAIFNLLLLYANALSSLGLLDAILVSKSKEDFVDLSKLIFQIHLLFFGLVVLLHVSLPSSDFINQYKRQLPYVLLAVLFQVFNRILQSYHLRENNFKENSIADFSSNFLSKLFSIFYGILMIPFGNGLILGAVLLQTIGCILRARKNGLAQVLISFKKILSFEKTRSIFVGYKKYVYYIYPSNLILTFSYYLPVLVISSFYDQKELGIFFFALNMLSLPMKVIGNSLKHTFFSKIWQEKDDYDKISSAFVKLQKALCIIGLPVLFVVIIFSDFIFSFAFGEQWEQAGAIATFLAPSFFFQFLTSPFGQIRRIMGFERGEFIIQIIILVLRGTLFLYIYVLRVNFLDAIAFYGIINSVCYLIAFYDFYYVLKLKLRLKQVLVSLGIGLLIGCGFLIKYIYI